MARLYGLKFVVVLLVKFRLRPITLRFRRDLLEEVCASWINIVINEFELSSKLYIGT